MSKQTKPQNQRQFLQPSGGPTIPPKSRIKTLKKLREHLQAAILVEHTTIPLYLCALYSIKDGYSLEAAQVIKSVVLEEMLHMILASNVLNAIRGSPIVNQPKFIPKYGRPLPHSARAFNVNLEKFSKESIETFLKIEKPAKPAAPPEGDRFHSLSQFYEAIELALLEFSGINVDVPDIHGLVDHIMAGEHDLSDATNIFTGDLSRQIMPEYYYGGGGEAIPVIDLVSALKALHEITGQGEGVHHSIWDGDKQLGQVRELAHYFRFNEIYLGRRYRAKDKVNGEPSGEKLIVHWDQVYPMKPNPKMGDHKPGSPVWHKTREFNRTYVGLLDDLNASLNGKPQCLMQSVARMYDLRYQVIELMKIPIGNGEMTAGPSFEYVS